MHQNLAIKRLQNARIIEISASGTKSTRRWQAAMARAALDLLARNDPSEDIRVPITYALLQLYGNTISDNDLFDLVTAMLPIEQALSSIAQKTENPH